MLNPPILSLIIIVAFAMLTGCTGNSGAKADSIPSKDISQAAKPESKPESGNKMLWVKPDGRSPRFLFIHHSTGSGFLDEGGMRDKIKAAGFETHDRTYGNGWVGDHTDPPDFPVTFTQHYDDMISWELGPGEKYDIVAFKSCFPASDIQSDAMLQQYKDYYATIKTVARQHPETLFIAWSTPPLVPGATSPENAKRARAWANWLTDEYQKDEGNIRVYNLFEVLADNSNVLKKEYRRNESDSHPNAAANKTVAEDFTRWLLKTSG